MSNLNKKHPSTKFEFKYSQTKNEFLDIVIYKDQNNILETAIYKKQTNKITSMPDQSTRNCWKIAYPTAKLYG